MTSKLDKEHEHIALFREAMWRLEQLPSWEKDRCIKTYVDFLYRSDSPKLVKRFKQQDRQVQWNSVKCQIAFKREPFEEYKPELAGVV